MLILGAFLSTICGYSQDTTVSIYPSDIFNEVVFGGDGKLTIRDWKKILYY